MTTTAAEDLPVLWDDARDIPFFRITARLFSPELCLAAGVLLASYDDDTVDTAQHAPAQQGASTTAPARPHIRAWPEPDLVPCGGDGCPPLALSAACPWQADRGGRQRWRDRTASRSTSLRTTAAATALSLRLLSLEYRRSAR
jgi:hypothetical protein